jgi:hypothetical protein
MLLRASSGNEVLVDLKRVCLVCFLCSASSEEHRLKVVRLFLGSFGKKSFHADSTSYSSVGRRSGCSLQIQPGNY